MAGIPGKGGVKGKSGPPGNTNAFKHGWRLFRSSRAVRMDHRTIEPAPRDYSTGAIAAPVITT